MSPAPIVEVLVAEDSSLYAETIVEVIEQDPRFRVVDVVGNGKDAVARCAALCPSVVLLDVLMPVMNGLDAIEHIMSDCPTPILVMTADPGGRTGEISFEALRRGALDVVAKPAAWAGTAAEQEDLRARLELVSRIPVVRRRTSTSANPSVLPPRSSARGVSFRAVGLVASTGGPPVLARILGRLDASFRVPMLVVQHLAAGFAPQFARWLNDSCSLDVRLAEPGMPLSPGQVLVAPDGAHLRVGRGGTVRLTRGEPGELHCPSGSRLLTSLAEAFGPRVIGGILTGMGDDGVVGLKAVRRAGGVTFAQDESSCAVYGMPGAAASTGVVDHTLSPDDAALWLLTRAQK